MNTQPSLGGTGRRRQREVIDVPEAVKPNRSLDKLIALRKQRLQRMERERNEAREAWRAERAALRTEKERWREALEQAGEYWRTARAAFLSMTITSGQFRKSKAIYERMKMEAADIRIECGQCAIRCKERRAAFFNLKRECAEANRNHERLNILRDEMIAMEARDEQ